MDASASPPQPDAAPTQESEPAAPPGLLGAVGRMLPLGGSVALPLRGLRQVFAAFHSAAYRRVWFAALASNIGTWVQNVALGWLVYRLSGSAFWLGVFGFASQAPMVLLLPFGGVLADRVDRRWIIATSNIVLSCVALLLAAAYALDMVRVWHLIAVASVAGTFAAALIPANQSLLPRLVERRDLANAVALNAMQFNLSRVAGPAIGGVVMTVLGVTWSFLINAATFVPLIGVMASLPPQRSVAQGQRPQAVFESLRDGWRYLRQRPDLMAMEALVFCGGFCIAPVMHMLPAYVEAALGGKASQYSLLLSAFGFGAVLGAAALAARSRRGPRPWRALPLLAGFGLCQAALALPMSLASAMALLAGCGLTFIGANNRLFAAILASTPDHLRGRISSIHVLFFSTGLPLGSLLAGTIARSVGVRPLVAMYGGAMIVAVGVIFAVVRARGVEYQPAAPTPVAGAAA